MSPPIRPFSALSLTHNLLYLPQRSTTTAARLPLRSFPRQTTSTSTTTTRPFSTTPLLSVRGFANPNLGANAHTQPAYPPGTERWYKRANRGLYGHVRRRTGNNVSEEHSTKTRRRWYPNVHNKRLWSESLNRFVRVRVVIRVLRTIDKVGGLDNYLLGQGPGRIKELGPVGWALRWRVLRTEKGRAVWEGERKRLGLEGEGPRGEVWRDPLAEVRGMEGRLLPSVEGEGEIHGEEMSEEVLEAREREIDRELDEREEGGEAADLTEETATDKRRGWFRRG